MPLSQEGTLDWPLSAHAPGSTNDAVLEAGTLRMYRAAALLVGIVSSLYFSADGDAAANDDLYLIFLALVVFGASLTGRFIPRPFEHSHHALDGLTRI